MATGYDYDRENTAAGMLLFAGPCMAESYALLDETASFLSSIAQNTPVIFKASFDKANRTSLDSERGPGLEKALTWLYDIKQKYSLPLITDVHETWQVEPVAEVCDVLQIPAFLCRQTDLLVKACQTGLSVNIKKGQFMAPSAMEHILKKAQQSIVASSSKQEVFLTERGVSFGYSNLVVDMRALKIMSDFGGKVIFDITHSTQMPSSQSCGTSGADRTMAPLLARAAASSGYCDGFFFEVHPDPKKALSDKAAQLDFAQVESLLSQLKIVQEQAKRFVAEDQKFYK